MSTILSVNLNAIAHLRNRRDLPWPNIIDLGRIALQAGAGGLTVHPRPDERHIRFQDVVEINSFLQDEFPKAEFNIEGFPSESFLIMAEKYADQVTLVPDDPTQSTSDHGWDFSKYEAFLKPIIKRLIDAGKRISLFADPSEKGLDIAQKLGTHRVEFYTGPYGGTYNNAYQATVELEKLKTAAEYAHSLGLDVNAGHDLTVANLPALVKAIPFLAEVSIGHGLIADALEYGMKQTVERYMYALSEEAE